MSGFGSSLGGYAGVKFSDHTGKIYGLLYGMSSGGASMVGIGMPELSSIGFPAGFSLTSEGDAEILGYKAYSSKNIQCGEAMVPNGSLSGSVYTGEEIVYFSPPFSKAPRVTITARTAGPYNVIASLGGNPTANSVKIIVQRNTKTADGYTAVQWIAVEPD